MEIYCPHCGNKEWIDPEYPEDPMMHICEECGEEYGYQAKIKHKIRYFVEWKKK